MKKLLITTAFAPALALMLAPETGAGGGGAAPEPGGKPSDDKAAAAKAAEAKKTEPKKTAAKKTAAKPKGEMIVVNCPLASGRRRAGRRWPAGQTEVDSGEFTKEQLEALAGDTYLTVTPANAKGG